MAEPVESEPMLALSLFSGAGIGDIGFRAAGYEFLGFCELEGDRLGIARHNFPAAHFFVGDIWTLRDDIVTTIQRECDSRGEELQLISCTAPCQGMSKNGQGTLLKNAREGKRPKLDPRNRLIIPALDVITRLRPRTVVFENVTEMRRTLIEDDHGRLVSILDLIGEKLGPEYSGRAYDVEFADYGIPQRRQRLITVFSRVPRHRSLLSAGGELVPPQTHSRSSAKDRKKWVSVTEALRGFPPLDARSKERAKNERIKYHRVPLLDELKYEWVANTPPGRSAFDNQCTKCGFQENGRHSTARNKDGINRASRETPLYCERCGEMLPRPSVVTPDGTRRIMSGYTSAYKRMAADLPAPALTRNFSYACSDQKVHPTQNRVLSIAEALKIHTISDYGYEWVIAGENGKREASDGLIRLVIGESIPPRFLEILGRYLKDTESCDISRLNLPAQQHTLELEAGS